MWWRTSSVGDDFAKSTVIAMIFGIPLLLGISIIALPFLIISAFIDVPMGILVKCLLIFGGAVFIVWLFSKFQIIENAIVGLIIGRMIYTYFDWHPVFCILIGLVVVGVLFVFSNLKVGFWVKTIVFSFIITLIVFTILYSTVGLFPLSDIILKYTFFIIFLIENLYIRYSVYNSGEE